MAAKRPLVQAAGSVVELSNTDTVRLTQLAVADGATTPDPGAPVWAWSTTENAPVYWSGSAWIKPATGALATLGANTFNGLQSITGPNYQTAILNAATYSTLEFQSAGSTVGYVGTGQISGGGTSDMGIRSAGILQLAAGSTAAAVTITNANTASSSAQWTFTKSGTANFYDSTAGSGFGFKISGTQFATLGSAANGLSGGTSTDLAIQTDSGNSIHFATGGVALSNIRLTLPSSSAYVQIGAPDAAAPAARAIQAQGSRTGTDTNIAGAALTIRPGKGTGNATPGALILQSYVAVASGTGAQTATTTLTLNNGVPVFPSFTVANLPAAATAGAGARAFVTDSNQTTTAGIGTNVAAGGANFNPVYCDGTNWKIG